MTGLSPVVAGGRDGVVARLVGSLERTQRAAFITPNQITSWFDWLELVERNVAQFRRFQGTRVGLILQPTARGYASFIALGLLDCHVAVLDPASDRDAIVDLSGSHGLFATIDGDSAAEDVQTGAMGDGTEPSHSGPDHAGVTIFSSGSTGRPKPVRHSWDSLLHTVGRVRSRAAQSWLLTYRAHLYAGLQVFLHCLLNQWALVIPDALMPVNDLVSFMRKAQVRSVSATPSYWRRMVAFSNREALASVSIEQITLGGEVADQRVLESLKDLYPTARIVHIYATTELGRCFSVDDARPGFPARFLDSPPDQGVELKIVDGELHVRSRNAMLSSTGEVAAATSWIPTGDLVECDGERCLFIGRMNDLINVGGEKVQPLRVEHVIQRIPGVRDARVFARSSSLVGQMVACEFVAEPGFEPGEVKARIEQICRERLTAAARPRFVEAVPQISLSSAGKKCRNLSSNV